MAGSNGKWLNPVPASVDPGVSRALQSLSSYLGGWQDWSGTFDLSFTVAGYNANNATKRFEYQVLGDKCFYHWEFLIGSTTTIPTAAGSEFYIKLPFTPAASIGFTQSYPIGQVRALDASTGIFASGAAIGGGSLGAKAILEGATNIVPGAAGTVLVDYWRQTAGSEHPFRTGVGARTAWTNGDSLWGSGWYRIEV